MGFEGVVGGGVGVEVGIEGVEVEGVGVARVGVEGVRVEGWGRVVGGWM